MDKRCPQCGRHTGDGELCWDCRNKADAQLQANQAQTRLANEQMRLLKKQEAAQRQAELEQRRREKILSKAVTRLNQMKEEVVQLNNRIPLLQSAINSRDFVSMKKLSKKRGSGCLKWAIILIGGFLAFVYIVCNSGSMSECGRREENKDARQQPVSQDESVGRHLNETLDDSANQPVSHDESAGQRQNESSDDSAQQPELKKEDGDEHQTDMSGLN